MQFQLYFYVIQLIKGTKTTQTFVCGHIIACVALYFLVVLLFFIKQFYN